MKDIGTVIAAIFQNLSRETPEYFYGRSRFRLYSEAHFIKAHDESLLTLNQGGVRINRKQTLN